MQNEIDVAKLEKVVDFSLSLPEYKTSPGFDVDQWFQGDWMSIFAPNPEKPGASKFVAEAMMTDQGLMTMESDIPFKCTTAACIAGNTALLFAPKGTIFRAEGSMSLPGSHGEKVSVSDWARDELGLTDDEAGLLFNGGNTAETVRSYTNKIIAGEFRD